MRITSFEIRNYRSITTKSRISLDDLTVLIGPNNEGKSNLLRAFVTAARVLAGGRYYKRGRFGAVRYRYGEPGDYEWERDYPAALRTAHPEGTSDFRLSFDLSNQELRDFRAQTGIRLTGTLVLKLELGREGANFDVSMRGPAKKRLNQKRAEIAEFLREHFDFQYIPSVRISELSEELVERMLARGLASLENEEAYAGLLEQLRALQRPILDELGRKLANTVRAFVPEVKEIRVENQEGLLRAVRRNTRVLVDDGTLTELALKGDGVQSLVAIALMHHVAQSTAGQKSLLLAIEEPEAHLHPEGIHRLKRVIEEITGSFQVILTTHSPLMVERARPGRNIIVRSASARPAKSLREIRECLGVRLADNLISAFLVLLVEGESDEKILRAWLPLLQPELSSHLKSGTLGFDTLRGTTNLAYKASMYKKEFLCNCHAFLDDDQAGRAASERAVNDEILDGSEVHIATCPALNESELEDLADVASYQERIEQTFRVDLGVPHFRNSRTKWSERLRTTFRAQGRQWNIQTEARCKGIVAHEVEKNPRGALHRARQGSIEACAGVLLQRIQGR